MNAGLAYLVVLALVVVVGVGVILAFSLFDYVHELIRGAR